MNKTESLYLDFIRVTAALLVFFSHFDQIFPKQPLSAGHGHDAVVIFFVLSGYVISYVVDTKESSQKDYLLSRFSRLYSVAIPSLIITVLCDNIGLAVNPSVYTPYAGDWPVVRIASASFFASEFWFFSIQPLSNGPFWSLCYEFWYYCLFAACYFYTGKHRITLAILITLLIGPKILLLMQIWLLGVILYRNKLLRTIGFRTGLFCFISSFFIFYVFEHFGIYGAITKATTNTTGPFLNKYLAYSNNFFCDYITGIIVFINIAGFRALSLHLPPRKLIELPIRHSASFTLSIYLYHYPILKMLGAIIEPDIKYRGSIAITISILIIVLLGIITEHKKNTWRNIFERAFELLRKPTNAQQHSNVR